MTQIRIASLAAGLALACAASPAPAQLPAGPVATAPARLAMAQLPPASAFRGTPDPARELAAQLELSKPRLYYSIPLSLAFAFAGGAVGYGVGFVGLDCSDESSNCSRGPDNAEYLTMALGLAAGAASGAHIGGRRHDSTGGFLAALGGAAVGTIPLLIADKESDSAVNTGAFVSLASSTAGAVLMDYLVRRPRH